MSKKILKDLSQSVFAKILATTPAPRWMVLIADMTIVFACSILTILLNMPDSTLNIAITNISAIVIVHLIVSLIFKSYQYILRLSAIEDIYRLALQIAFASFALAIIDIGIEYFSDTRYISMWNIFIVGMFSFSIMMCMRLAMKYTYSLFVGNRSQRKRVIVLGSAINSFVLASALKAEREGGFEPVALLSLSDKKISSIVNGIPIIQYEENKVSEVFSKYNCDTLLFISTQIELMRNGFADIFLNNHIKLLLLNQVEEFDLGSNQNPSLSPHVRNIKIEDLLGRETIRNINPNINYLIQNQVVLITGAAGSIGSEIVRQVAFFGAKDIVLVDQAETPMHELQLEIEKSYPNINIHLFIGDITNNNRMEIAFHKYNPRYVFHAAAYKHVPMMENNPSEAIMTNVFGTKNLADLAIKYNVEKFVMISTDKAVNPTNIMGASKRIAEIYVQSLFLHNKKSSDKPTTRFITTRFGNVLGSNGSVIPLFSKQIEEGGPVTITHKEIIRYFMTIPEACSLVLEAGCMGSGGEIYVFDMGKPVKIYDLACRMITLAGLKVGEDIEIIETGLRPGEKLYEELLNDKESTLATYHKKIMIAKVNQYDYISVIQHLNNLFNFVQTGNNHDLITEMKLMLPEYKSQNSKWEKIDNEIEKSNS